MSDESTDPTTPTEAPPQAPVAAAPQDDGPAAPPDAGSGAPDPASPAADGESASAKAAPTPALPASAGSAPAQDAPADAAPVAASVDPAPAQPTAPSPDTAPTEAVTPAPPPLAAPAAETPVVPGAGGPAASTPVAPPAPIVSAPDPAAPAEPASARQPAAPASEAPDGAPAEAPAGSDISQAASDASAGAPADAVSAPAGDKPKRRRSRGGGSKVAKAWGVKAANVDSVKSVDLTPSGDGVPVGGKGRQRGKGGGGKGQRPKGGRPPRPPREKGPLPFDELREAARTVVELQGKRTALKDAFTVLAAKERADLSELVARDGDFRVRARGISAGSLSAGKIGKALAAQQIAIADVQDLWTLTLSKEDAAERQSHVRNAKRRDEERAKKQAERRNSADRISKEDMHKARDGHVTASVRMDPAILAAFGGGGDAPAPVEESEAAPKQEKAKKQPARSSVLDRLGY